MVEWLKRLVFREGNVIRDRSYTNWNTLDVDAIIAEKERQAERFSGTSKGFGFLEFSNEDEARAAITGLDGRDVNGRAVKVNESRPRNAGPQASPRATQAAGTSKTKAPRD
jgi:RNA recognition motif-containing protein